jgi:hypothetical protein
MTKFAFRPKTKEFSPHPQQLKQELEAKGISIVDTSPRMVVIESTKETADQILLELGENWRLFEIDPSIVYTTA